MAKPRFNDRFVAGTLIGALPLLVWAAHFFVAYLTVKTACALGLQRFTFDGIPLITLLLGLLSAAAIGALLWMIALQRGETRRHFDGGGTLAIVHTGASVLALAGVLWSTLPIVLVPPCANFYQ
jgi:hypothetical protein